MIIIYVYHINAVSRIYDQDLLLIVYKYHMCVSYVCIIWMWSFVLVIICGSYMSVIYGTCIWGSYTCKNIFLIKWSIYDNHICVSYKCRLSYLWWRSFTHRISIIYGHHMCVSYECQLLYLWSFTHRIWVSYACIICVYHICVSYELSLRYL